MLQTSECTSPADHAGRIIRWPFPGAQASIYLGFAGLRPEPAQSWDGVVPDGQQAASGRLLVHKLLALGAISIAEALRLRTQHRTAKPYDALISCPMYCQTLQRSLTDRFHKMQRELARGCWRTTCLQWKPSALQRRWACPRWRCLPA